MALQVRPNRHPAITMLCDDRQYLDLAVRVDVDMELSAGAFHLERDIYIVYAEDGGPIVLSGNRRVGEHIVCGTFYIVGIKDGKLRSLTDREISSYSKHYWEPELFTDDELLDSWLDNLSKGL